MQASKLVSDWSMHWSRDMLLKKPLLLSSLWQTRVVFVLDSIVNIFAVHFSALYGAIYQSIPGLSIFPCHPARDE